MAEKRLYEGMFLVDAGQDFEAATQPIHAVLDRGEGEIVAIKPWDERRLAYEIAGRKRGLYVLVYFKMDPANLTEVEHDVQLNEHLLRALFLRKDALSDEVIHAETPATTARRSEESSEATEEGASSEAPAEAKDAPAKAEDAPAGAEEAPAEVEDAPVEAETVDAGDDKDGA
ncbi:MAG: 30S ribosomal protein S6 [Planctomycetota bacterium]|jgi:small subunit ribosomal protein S6